MRCSSRSLPTETILWFCVPMILRSLMRIERDKNQIIFRNEISFKTTGEKMYSAKKSQIQDLWLGVFHTAQHSCLGQLEPSPPGSWAVKHRVQNVCRCGFGDQSHAVLVGKWEVLAVSSHSPCECCSSTVVLSRLTNTIRLCVENKCQWWFKMLFSELGCCHLS